MRTSVLIWLIILLADLPAHSQIIITSAGTGGTGYSGDGGPATSANLFNPYGVTLDAYGSLYICDNGNRRIRKVSPAFGGIITTVVGNGTAGFSGDGHEAIYAQIRGVLDIAFDKNGNMFLADGGDNRIRKVSSSGIISTYCGTGFAGYNGDGIPATGAQISSPASVCVDDTGNVIFADKANHRIRKIDTFGTIRTIAGNGTTGYSPDSTIALTASLDENWSVRIGKNKLVYFGDNYRIRLIDTFGRIKTIAGNGVAGSGGNGGPSIAAELNSSVFCFDTIGNIFICDGISNVVRTIGKDGVITKVAGTGSGGFSGDNGPPLLANLNSCSGITVADNGDIFIGDLGNDRIRMVSNHIAGVAHTYVTEPKLEVYPNPATDFLNIELHGVSAEEAEVSIRAIDGRLVGRYCMQPAAPLRLSANWPAGTYVVRVTTATATLSKTITINTQK